MKHCRLFVKGATLVGDPIPGLVDLFICPACHAQLAWDYESSELICSSSSCGLAYPVREGIPVLVIDEARRPAAR